MITRPPRSLLDSYLIVSQYGPNIAQWILTHAPFNVSFPLKGIALGNACWGGDEHSVNCNGPNEEQNDVDMFFGKGLISKKLHERVYKGCRFPLKAPPTGECESLLEEVHSAVGPHNVYNIYDDCAGSVQPKLTESGRSMRWLTKHLREPLSSSTEPSSAQIDRRKLADGGYTWACGGEDATSKWLLRPDVRAALHLGSPAESSFKYTTSGPASITLYPHLITRLRVLIYNGDADACVPVRSSYRSVTSSHGRLLQPIFLALTRLLCAPQYKGNEEWIDSLVEAGDLTENSAWRPWYTSKSHVRTAPAGYVTTYNVSHGKHDFSFLTIRLAGHMVSSVVASFSCKCHSVKQIQGRSPDFRYPHSSLLHHLRSSNVSSLLSHSNSYLASLELACPNLKHPHECQCIL